MSLRPLFLLGWNGGICRTRLLARGAWNGRNAFVDHGSSFISLGTFTTCSAEYSSVAGPTQAASVEASSPRSACVMAFQFRSAAGVPNRRN